MAPARFQVEAIELEELYLGVCLGLGFDILATACAHREG
jgi:hypothetical protein